MYQKQLNFAGALQYALDELKGDIEFILKAVTQNAYCLKYASNELKGNREIVLEADREIVLGAIKYSADAVQFASDKLPDFVTIILLSIKYDYNILFW